MKKRTKRKERKQRFSLTLLLSAVVFVIIFFASLFAFGVVSILVQTNVLDITQSDLDIIDAFWFIVLISVVIGTGTTMIIGKIPLKPVNTLINKINRLASGDYKTRLEYNPPLTNHPAFKELSESFNTLATELENTEMLSSDFINNFSHEFKTPIVSIAGFAKLLKKGNLTEEQMAQYLDAIEEESIRLSQMATNILNLTKIESLAILTNVSKYNLSEQVRSCVLLLEERWSKKDLELELDFDEYMIEANEEMLRHVFINLIDNAVKFSNHGGRVAVTIKESDKMYEIEISNNGSGISEEHIDKIWNKFYQADESHSSEGSGIGLAMVKKIVDLHTGNVEVESRGGETVFTVKLYQKLREFDI